MSYSHTPVLTNELLQVLNLRPGARVIDGTLGGAGHAREVLAKILPDGALLGIDLDSDAIQNAQALLQEYSKHITLVHDNFKNISEIAAAQDFTQVDAIYFDFGFSSYHVDQSERGFSFRKSEPLDMRFDTTSQGPTAADIVNTFPESELRRIFWQYGEERHSRAISAGIVKQRSIKKIQTTDDLVACIMRAAPLKQKQTHTRIHPATRVFQALRIATNDELGNIETVLKTAVGLLKKGGVIAAISFHSLEDRLVKNAFREASRDCICPPDIPECRCDHEATLEIITKKPFQASDTEQAENPRARSAKLRAARRI